MNRRSSFLINRDDISVEEFFETIYKENDSIKTYEYLKTKVYKSREDRHSYYSISFILGIEANKRSFDKNKKTVSSIRYLDIDTIILRLDKFMKEMDSKVESCDEVLKNINKLLDHVKLEKLHLDNMNSMRESYLADVEEHKYALESMNLKYKKDLESSKQELDEKSQSLHKEVIGLLGIFTALAFISFGGMTVLDKFFEGIGKEGIRLRQLIILGSFTSLAIINIVYLFLYGIIQISGINKNVFRKSLKKVYVIANIVMLMGIALGCSTYIIENNYIVKNITYNINETLDSFRINYFIDTLSWIILTSGISIIIVTYMIKPSVGVNIIYNNSLYIGQRNLNNGEQDEDIATN